MNNDTPKTRDFKGVGADPDRQLVHRASSNLEVPKAMPSNLNQVSRNPAIQSDVEVSGCATVTSPLEQIERHAPALMSMKTELEELRAKVSSVERETISIAKESSGAVSAATALFADSNSKLADALRGLSDAIVKLADDRTKNDLRASEVEMQEEKGVPLPPALSSIRFFTDKIFGQSKTSLPTLSLQLKAISSSGLFDTEWYISNGGVPKRFESNPILHYLKIGAAEGRDPSPVFSTRFYIEANPDVRGSGLNPLYHFAVIGKHQGRAPTALVRDLQGLDHASIVRKEFDAEYYIKRSGRDFSSDQALEHFLRQGWREGRDPNPRFSIRYYLEHNPDIRRVGINPFLHYLLSGRNEGRLPQPFPDLSEAQIWQWRVLAREFDVNYYLECHPDVRSSGVDPIKHYLLAGWTEDRDPSPNFSTAFYLDAHPDVRSAGVCPYFHFLEEGRKEGRSTKSAGQWPTRNDVRLLVQQQFDCAFYASSNPDVVKAGVEDLLSHFLEFGWRERRDPSADFSVSYYLDANADVAEAGINPLYHYLVAGQMEGREAMHPGGWRAKHLTSSSSLSSQIIKSFKDDELHEQLLDQDQLSIELAASGYSTKSKILLSVSHDDYTKSVGGVQLCIKLEEELAKERGVVHINVHPLVALPALAPDAESRSTRITITCNGKKVGSSTVAELADVIGAPEEGGAERYFVIHSLLGHLPESISSLWRRLQPERSFFWIHDYFSICPGYTLLRSDVSFCGAPSMNSLACSVCRYGEERESHLDRFKDIFDEIGFDVIAPSAFAAELWKEKSSLSAKEVHVVEHCTLQCPQQRPARLEGPFRIAYIGHPASHKGWNTFVLLLREFAQDSRYEFHHLGVGPQRDSRAMFTPVSVGDHGPGAMVEALLEKDIDVAINWSIWPETFSFVTNECLRAGVKVLTSEASGNIARMVQDNEAGVVLAREEDLLEMFRSGSVCSLALDRRFTYRPSYSKLTFEFISSEKQP